MRAPPDRSNKGSRALFAALLCLLACIPVLSLALPSRGEVAVIGGRGRSAADMVRVVARAGGAVMRGGGAGNIIVAVSSEPGFVARLYREGAWLVLDPLILGGCVPSGAEAAS